MALSEIKCSKYRLNFQDIASFAYACALGLGAAVLLWQLATSHSRPPDTCIAYETITNASRFTPIGQRACALSLERVDTETLRRQGLSGRAGMPSGRGMLFVFDRIGRQCIWMKDMEFSLDILWLDARGTILKVAESISPASYPDEYCTDNTLFVIEVNAGVAKSPGLQLGSHIDL
ncbi:DUF192 domain-containing protein [soil metagenome]